MLVGRRICRTPGRSAGTVACLFLGGRLAQKRLEQRVPASSSQPCASSTSSSPDPAGCVAESTVPGAGTGRPAGACRSCGRGRCSVPLQQRFRFSWRSGSVVVLFGAVIGFRLVGRVGPGARPPRRFQLAENGVGSMAGLSAPLPSLSRIGPSSCSVRRRGRAAASSSSGTRWRSVAGMAGGTRHLPARAKRRAARRLAGGDQVAGMYVGQHA